jgi:sugar lactone lactonase YvrE
MTWNFERVASPFQGPANGVVWDGKTVIFSLMEDMKLMRFDPESGTTSEIRKYTNRVNGLAFGRRGELLGCQEGGRRLVEFSPDGRMFAVDALLDGKYHNHPSDLAVDSQARIWFADPHSATLAFGPQIFPPLDHASVLRLEKNERNAWVVRRITFDTAAPRSVLLSPDEKTLYVAEGEPGGGRRELRAYPIGDDGAVGSCRVLHTFGEDYRGPHRGIEGMCLDADGNIVAVGGWRKSGAGPLAQVFSPEGAVIESHALPGDVPNRCCFGGAGLDTLYVTTGNGELYRAKTTRRGRERAA